MRDDDAWNCGSVVRPDENGRWASGISTIIHRDTKETDADWMVRVMAGIKQANVSTMKRTVGEQKLAIVSGAGHRTIIGMRERKLTVAIVRFCQTTKQDRIWGNVEADRFRCRQSKCRIGACDIDRVDVGGCKTRFKI